MIHILESYGIIHHYTSNRLTYTDTYAKVIIPDGETDNFRIIKGVFQCDTLVTFLFVTKLDYAMRQDIDGREVEFGLDIIQRQGRQHLAIQLIYISYADDI